MIGFNGKSLHYPGDRNGYYQLLYGMRLLLYELTNKTYRKALPTAVFFVGLFYIAAGGIHPTCWPKEVLNYSDSVVLGEAEYLWLRVLTDLEKGELRRVYRNIEPIRMEDRPIPAWDLLKVPRYMFTNTLCISRGCPWRCRFCYNSCPEIERLGVKHVMNPYSRPHWIGLNRFRSAPVQHLPCHIPTDADEA